MINKKIETNKTNMKTKAILLIAVFILSTLTILPMASAAPLTSITATADPTTAGATTAFTIAFTTATSGDIATIEMEFPTEFDVSNAALGTISGISAGTIAVVDQLVTYTVTTPATIAGAIAISIELTSIVNTETTGSAYIVDVETLTSVPGTIDGPTPTTTFEITPAALGSFAFTTQPPTILTKDETITTLTEITAYDIYLNVKTDYVDTAATLTSSDPAYVFTSWTWTDEKVTAISYVMGTFGTHTLTVTDGTISKESNPILVSTFHHLDITVPEIVTKGTLFTITVTAKDEAENTLIDYAGIISFTSTDPEEVLPSDGPLSVGTGSFDITLNTFGVHTITVSEDVKSSVSDPITVGMQWDDSAIEGYAGEDVTVYALVGEAPTPGGLLNVYWDEVHAWNSLTGTGLIATGYANADESFQITVTIPETVASVDNTDHAILIYDDMTNSLLTSNPNIIIMPDIVLYPTAGVDGDTITVTGTGFATESEITLSGTDILDIVTVPSTVITNEFGSFTCEFDIVALMTDTYVITATDASTELNDDDANLEVGTVITLTPKTGLVGITTTVEGRGFTPEETVDIRWYLTENDYVTLVNDYDIDLNGEFTTTLTVPLVPDPDAPGKGYTVKAYEGSTIEAVATFTVVEDASITLDPKKGDPDDSFTVTGGWFTDNSDIVIYWAGVSIGEDRTDSFGAFDFAVTVPEDAIPGSYTVKTMDAEGVYDTATFTVNALPAIVIETRAAEYMPGDTVTFYINSTLELDILIDIKDPSDYPYKTFDIDEATSWTLVGNYYVITYDLVSFDLPSDANEGLWNWTAEYTLNELEIKDTDLFTVGEPVGPQPELPAETTDQAPKDSNGVVKTSFALGETVLASAKVSNAGTQSQPMLIIVQWKDPQLRALAPVYIIVELAPGADFTYAPGLTIPLTGYTTGTWTARILVLDTWPAQGGVTTGTPATITITVTG